MPEFTNGDKVIAYPRTPGEVGGTVNGPRLSFNAYNVRTVPVAVKGSKRKQRLDLVVHESQLERADG